MRPFTFASALLAGATIVIPQVDAALITPGNPVVMRIDITALGTLRGAPTFLDEYDANSGALVQTFAMPTSGASALTIDHPTAQEGLLSTTPDKSKIVFGGYRWDAATTISGQSLLSLTVPRVIGVLSASGAVDTSFTTFAGGTAANSLRSVASADGSSFYMATGSNATGVGYAALSGGTMTAIASPNRNSRTVIFANINGAANTLVGADGASSVTDRVRSYGVTPTSANAGSPIADFGTGSSHSIQGIALVDLNPSIAGDDTLYLVQAATAASNAGLQKWSFDGTSWSFNSFIPHLSTATGGFFLNLAANSDGANVQMFLTTEFGLYKITDSSGYGGTLTGTPSLLTGLTSGGTTKFRGVAVVPEPAALTAIGALALIARRRKQ